MANSVTYAVAAVALVGVLYLLWNLSYHKIANMSLAEVRRIALKVDVRMLEEELAVTREVLDKVIPYCTTRVADSADPVLWQAIHARLDRHARRLERLLDQNRKKLAG